MSKWVGGFGGRDERQISSTSGSNYSSSSYSPSSTLSSLCKPRLNLPRPAPPRPHKAPARAYAYACMHAHAFSQAGRHLVGLPADEPLVVGPDVEPLAVRQPPHERAVLRGALGALSAPHRQRQPPVRSGMGSGSGSRQP